MAAAGIIYNANGRVLLLKRCAETDKHPGCWGLPAGGVEDGETPEQGAMREFAEETCGTLGKPLTFVDELGGFHLFRTDGEEFQPTLNHEHTDFMWALPSELPQPLHPGLDNQLRCIGGQVSEAMDLVETDTARTYDRNGFVTIKRNPISRAGVFLYSGKSLPGGDPGKMYPVLRSPQELSRPATLESFKLLPIIDEHVMLGDGYMTQAEEKGVHGSTGEEVVFEGRDVIAPLRIFSSVMKRLIDSGKKGLSLGYKCKFEKSAGVFEGMPYDYIQTNILGNHLALVNEGRVGTEVLDHHWAFDEVEFALDETKGDDTMADENKADEVKKDDAPAKDDAASTEKKEMTLAEISAAMEQFMPVMAKMQEFMAASTVASSTEALDADEKKDEKKDDKKDEAMDAAEAKTLRTTVATLAAAVNEMKSRNSKEARVLAADAESLVGTFDHSEMTADEVAKYTLGKLGITGVPAGQERAAVIGALHATKSKMTFAMDSKPTVKAEGLAAKRAAADAAA